MNQENFKNYHQWMKNSFNLQDRHDLFVNYFKKNYLNYLPKNKEAKILDVACGMGQFLYFLKQQQYNNFEGVDLDIDNVKACHKIGLDSVYHGEMFTVINEKQDSEYDLVVLNDILEHIDSEKTVIFLKEINRILKENGTLIIKTVNCNNVYGLSSYFSDFTHVVGYNCEKIRHVGLLAGYKNVAVYNLYIYPNILIIDHLIKLFFLINYKIKRLFFYLNGRTTDNVFSKNLLGVLKK